MTRSLRSLLASLVAAVALAAAAAPAPAADLVVGLNMPSPGFQVGSARGTEVFFAKGLEVDLGRAIARELGRPARLYQEAAFTRLLAAGAKPWDIALAQVSITRQRDRRVDFSIPYLRADQGVLRRKGLPVPTTTIASLRPLRICTQRGTTAVGVIANRIRPTRRAVEFATTTLLLERVRTGFCDVAVLDLPILATLRAQAPDFFGVIAGRIVTDERYGIVLPERSALRAPVNAAIRRLQRTGRLQTITRRWLDVDVSGIRVLS